MLTIYTLEYSLIQGCYHIDTLDRVIKANRDLIKREISNGYLLIGIYPSYELAVEDKEVHEYEKDKRQDSNSLTGTELTINL
jgi:hypothetical protein